MLALCSSGKKDKKKKKRKARVPHLCTINKRLDHSSMGFGWMPQLHFSTSEQNKAALQSHSAGNKHRLLQK